MFELAAVLQNIITWSDKLSIDEPSRVHDGRYKDSFAVLSNRLYDMPQCRSDLSPFIKNGYLYECDRRIQMEGAIRVPHKGSRRSETGREEAEGSRASSEIEIRYIFGRGVG